MRSSKSLLLAAVGAMVMASCVTTALADSIVIDNFTNYVNLHVNYTNPNDTTTQTGLTGVLGGQRTGTLTAVHVENRNASYGDVYIEVGECFSSTTASAQTTALLTYGGAATPLDADFSSLGAGGFFLLKGWSLDQGTVNATVTLTSGTTTQSKLVSLSPALGVSPVDYTIAFSNFDTIDFAHVDVISLELANTSLGQDSKLTGFSAVPEPSVALAGLALLGTMGGLKTLRRQRAV